MKPVPIQRANQPRIAVIGAGWAGLSAAVNLAARGVEIVVFESARQPGGRARRVEWNGTAIDNGQHLLVGAYTETLALLATIGVDAATALYRQPMRVEVPGRFAMQLPRLPAPLHLAWGLVAARGASLAEKWAAVRFIRQLQADDYRLASDIPVAAWLDGHHQHGVLREHLWNALCLAALNTHPAEASAQTYAFVLRDTLGGTRSATDFLLPRGDLGTLLPDAAMKYLARQGSAIRLSARVVAAKQEGQRWRLTTKESSDSFDHVIMATGPQHVPALLPDDRRLDGLRRTLSEFAFEPIATAYLRYPPECRLPQPILALNDAPAQWLVDRGQLAPASAGIFAHVLSARGDWETLADSALVAALDARMREHLPSCGGLPQPLDHRVIRERRATFRCAPGLDRPLTATALPGLWLAGDYVASDYPGTLESAVRSGNAAAAAIAATL